MNYLITAAAGAMLLAAPALAQDGATGKGSFLSADGEQIGTATLTGTPTGVLIEIALEALPPDSWVAFHVHETGSCDPETDHESAGGHFNPTDVEHGYLTQTGPHAGDMPNQFVDADGVLEAQVFNGAVTLDEGEAGIMGRALMIHAGPDDYTSQPSGDAGDRLACAVIE